MNLTRRRRRTGWRRRFEPVTGRRLALETLPQLAAEGGAPFDFIFIDADKDNYPGYFEWALQLSRPGTIILADNVVRNGAVIDAASSDPRVQGVRRFHELVAADPRVSATTLQTVGDKGYDGFTLLVVTATGETSKSKIQNPRAA